MVVLVILTLGISRGQIEDREPFGLRARTFREGGLVLAEGVVLFPACSEDAFLEGVWSQDSLVEETFESRLFPKVDPNGPFPKSVLAPVQRLDMFGLDFELVSEDEEGFFFKGAFIAAQE